MKMKKFIFLLPLVVATTWCKGQPFSMEENFKPFELAFQKDAEFYAFWRSVDAYKQSFKNKGDMLILEPTSDFFKYLKNPAVSK